MANTAILPDTSGMSANIPDDEIVSDNALYRI
jgi:hypothetical protein